MFSLQPILAHELKVSAGARRFFWLRSAIAIVLATIAVCNDRTMLMFNKSYMTPNPEFQTADWYSDFFAVAVAISAAVAWTIAFLQTANVLGESIAKEREKGTLDAILMTNLSTLEILIAKLVGSLIAASQSLWMMAPWIAIALALKPLPVAATTLILAVSSSTLVVAGAIALLCSAKAEIVRKAQSWSALAIMGWIFSPFPFFMIRQSGVMNWNRLIEWFERIGEFVTRSSPFSLLFDLPSLITSRSLDALTSRFFLTLGLQAALFLVVLKLTIDALQPLRSRTAVDRRVDPAPEKRPEVGDDPIFWRERTMPARKSGLRAYGILIKQAIALAALIATTLLHLIKYLFKLSFIIIVFIFMGGLVFLFFRTAYSAGMEFWSNGFASTGPFQARQIFNFVARYVVCIFGFAILGTVIRPGMIVREEKNKQTWIPFLSTPLTGEEIISSKIKAVNPFLHGIVIVLSIAVVTATICGSVDPIAALWVIFDLWMAARAGVRIGIWQAIKSEPKPGSNPQAGSGAASLFIAAHILISVIITCSRNDINYMWNSYPTIATIAAAIALAAPISSEAIRRFVDRDLIENFDVWGDRPRRNSIKRSVDLSASVSIDSRRFDRERTPS